MPEPLGHTANALAAGPEHARIRAQALAWLQQGHRAVVIEVLNCQGSIPREAGTRMLVSLTHEVGTVGGGHLEWQAIGMARQALQEAGDGTLPHWQHRFPLGPALGQCCGGVVDLGFGPLNADTLAAWPASRPRFHLALYGAGHVGQAVVRLLATLDCSVRWIDARDHEAGWPGQPDAAWLSQLPAQIQYLSSPHPADEVADAPPGACHLVLTHRHDLDFEITEAILRRNDHRFAGLIGSQTKRARFLKRLAERGLSTQQLQGLTCPIGLAGITGKAPEVMAVSIVAQLLTLTSDQADHPA
jgi:xanthine dehydrogenase accessory factor